MGFDGYLKGYNAGKEAYRKLDTVSEGKLSLGLLRSIYIMYVSSLQAKKARMEEEIEKINEQYQKKFADPKIAEKQAEYNRAVADAQKALKEKLSAIVAAKKEQSRKYILIPPSQDQLTLLNAVKLRGAKNVPDEEWETIISAVAGNYQAAKILESIAHEGGREDFVAPVALSNVDEDLNMINGFFENAIDYVGDYTSSYRAMEIMREDLPNTATSKLIAKLDTELASTVPSASLSPKNRLKDAAQHALHVGDYETFNQIYGFIADNSARFQTAEEAQADFMEAVETLINKGMSAKEKSPYERKRDEVIRDLEKATGDTQNE